jgi:hypothetical protein
VRAVYERHHRVYVHRAGLLLCETANPMVATVLPILTANDHAY